MVLKNIVDAALACLLMLVGVTSFEAKGVVVRLAQGLPPLEVNAESSIRSKPTRPRSPIRSSRMARSVTSKPRAEQPPAMPALVSPSAPGVSHNVLWLVVSRLGQEPASSGYRRRLSDRAPPA